MSDDPKKKGRDAQFLSKQDHEQAYAKKPGRKRPFKKYKHKDQ